LVFENIHGGMQMSDSDKTPALRSEHVAWVSAWSWSGLTAIFSAFIYAFVAGPMAFVALLTAGADGRASIIPWVVTTALWPVCWYVAGRLSEVMFFFMVRRAVPLPWRVRLARRFGPQPPRRRRAIYAQRALRIGRGVVRLDVPSQRSLISPTGVAAEGVLIHPAPEAEVIDQPVGWPATLFGWGLVWIVIAMAAYWFTLPFAEDFSRTLTRAPVYFAIATFLGIQGVWVLGSSLHLRTVVADPTGVEVSPAIGRAERFTPEDSVVLVQGRWPGLVFVQLLRTDGVTRRVACSRPGFEHLIACWAAHWGADVESGDA
jgi:hypothetical protein